MVNTRQIRRFSLALTVCLGWSMQVAAQDPAALSQSLSLGAYYAEGDYGQVDDTEIRYFPISYEVSKGKWGFQLVLPHLEVTGIGSVLVNIGGVTRAVAGTQRTTSSGAGDTVMSAIYRFDPVTDAAVFIDLRVDVKLPTADEQKSLGTGETDYSVQVDMSRNVGNSLLFATIGHNFRGKSNLYTGLNDSAFAQLGLARPLSANWNAGLYYDFREAASVFSEETHELVPYISRQFSQHWSLTALAAWGFTPASADVSVLAQLSYRW